MLAENDKHLLAKIAKGHGEFIQSIDSAISSADDIVELVTEGLRGSVPVQMTAIEIIHRCPVEVRTRLLPALLQCSRSIGGAVADAILTLPKEWLIEHIEEAVCPLLEHADHSDFSFFLGVFYRINLAYARRLAHHAITNADPDIREFGIGFLSNEGA